MCWHWKINCHSGSVILTVNCLVLLLIFAVESYCHALSVCVAVSCLIWFIYLWDNFSFLGNSVVYNFVSVDELGCLLHQSPAEVSPWPIQYPLMNHTLENLTALCNQHWPSNGLYDLSTTFRYLTTTPSRSITPDNWSLMTLFHDYDMDNMCCHDYNIIVVPLTTSYVSSSYMWPVMQLCLCTPGLDLISHMFCITHFLVSYFSDKLFLQSLSLALTDSIFWLSLILL